MAKSVSLKSGLSFGTLTQAKQYFSDIREKTDPGSSVSESVKNDIIDLYNRYCSATNWPAGSAADIVVDWDNRERSPGLHAQTKAFHRVDEAGQKHVFSIDKALSAVAR